MPPPIFTHFMKIAVISDIHANLQAWKAILLDIRTLKADSMICLGDIIGYGPNPAEVLEEVYSNVDHMVLGNHDAATCGMIDTDLFNDNAQDSIAWTKSRLNNKAVNFLKSLPLSLAAEDFRCAHGEPVNPGAFNYVFQPEEASPVFESFQDNLFFIGHTHRPGIMVIGGSGIPRQAEAQDFELEEGKRYIVNVGSSGHPRDGSTHCSYCIYDSDLKSIFWRKIPFDIDSYLKAITDSGSPVEANSFLRNDPRLSIISTRGYIDFSPPKTPAQEVQTAEKVIEVKHLKRKLKRWRVSMFVAATALICLIAVLPLIIYTCSKQSVFYKGVSVMPRDVSSLNSAIRILATPQTDISGKLIGWDMIIGNKRKQSFQSKDINSLPALIIASEDETSEIIISSAEITPKPGQKFCMEALFRKSEDYHGSVALTVSLNKNRNGRLETFQQYLVKEPNIAKDDGWLAVKHTFTVPKDTKSFKLTIRGNFAGTIILKDVILTLKEDKRQTANLTQNQDFNKFRTVKDQAAL